MWSPGARRQRGNFDRGPAGRVRALPPSSSVSLRLAVVPTSLRLVGLVGDWRGQARHPWGGRARARCEVRSAECGVDSGMPPVPLRLCTFAVLYPRIAHFAQDSLCVRKSIPGRDSFHPQSAICHPLWLRLCASAVNPLSRLFAFLAGQKTPCAPSSRVHIITKLCLRAR
jgi:hypothetical protein